MNSDSTGLNLVLDVLPEPILLLQEGLVVYFNEAADALIPDLMLDAPCPHPLSFALPDPAEGGIAVCNMGGRHCTVTSTPTAHGMVITVRTIHDHTEKRRHWMPAFTEQMREQMTTLLAAAQQLESETKERNETICDKWLAVLNQSAYRLLRMAGAAELEQMLSDGEAYHPVALDLTELCHDLDMEISPIVKQLNIPFSYETDCRTLLTVGDPWLLRRMLLGMISNAIKAVGREGALGLRLARRNGRAVLTVWDNGTGMDDRSLGSLFQGGPDGFIPRPGEGLRLGLLNARNVAALHDGVLVVESKQGAGARFTVSLPIRQQDEFHLRSPKPKFDAHSGFSPLLVELSDALPWQMFLPSDLE